MRRGAPGGVARGGAAVVAMAVLAACSSGGSGGRGTTTTSSTTPSTTTSTAVVTTSSTVPATSSTTESAGAVTLRVTSFTLPDPRAGGTSLRVVVKATSPSLRVTRRGGAGLVVACPVTPVAPSPVGECVELPGGATVELHGVGVELAASRGEASADEVAVTYAAVDRSMTVVTPARPAGACEARPCNMTFTLTPGRPGPFTLDGRPGGGRPRLVLTATPSNRTLATVEGGGLLSIRATLEAGAEASLLHHEQGPGPVAPVTAEIFWP